ncbi:MAG TPA: hypothetical protein VKU84_08945, partial [Stellaceae bacterium]|nr:hypothetical protein [Stellaceae bacterium]
MSVSPNTGDKIISPSWTRRISTFAVGALIAVYLGFQAVALLTSHPDIRTPFALISLAVAALGGHLALSALTVSARLERTAIVRRSLFGRKALQISEIVSAIRSASRLLPGALEVRTANDRLTFTTVFSAAQLQEIQNHIRERATGSIREAHPQPSRGRVLRIIFVTIFALSILGVFVSTHFGANRTRCQERHIDATLRIEACTALIDAG